MYVSTVSVRVHEKRDHPYAYGHYDAEVVYTADVDLGDDWQDVERALVEKGAAAVKAECDRWEVEAHKRSDESYYKDWKEMKRLLRNLVYVCGLKDVKESEAYADAISRLDDLDDEIPF